jgi:hypothetical protein
MQIADLNSDAESHETGVAVTTDRQSFLAQLGINAQAILTVPERTPQ